jgi:hypothetical protein
MGKSRVMSRRGQQLGMMLGALLLAAPGVAFAGVSPPVHRIQDVATSGPALHMRVLADRMLAAAPLRIDPRLERGPVPGAGVSGGGEMTAAAGVS